MGSQEIASTRFAGDATLKAYYRFENGSELVDSSGNNNSLTDIGTPTYSSGKFGQGVDLIRTTTQGYSIVESSTLKPTSYFTVGLWMKSSASQGMLFQVLNRVSAYAGLYIYSGATHQLYCMSGRNTGTSLGIDWQQVTSTIAITDGTWRFIVYTWDGNYLNLYINGALDNRIAWTYAPAYAVTNYTRIGVFNDSGADGDAFLGSLDDVFMLNSKALTSDEIYSLYKTGVKKLNGVDNLTTPGIKKYNGVSNV